MTCPVDAAPLASAGRGARCPLSCSLAVGHDARAAEQPNGADLLACVARSDSAALHPTAACRSLRLLRTWEVPLISRPVSAEAPLRAIKLLHP
jgi:hypothetical protein